MFNTTDDEDEGSTPSGDNAERSLASTLGGSSESIPQQSSSSFLQAALDGPGVLSDRGERSNQKRLIITIAIFYRIIRRSTKHQCKTQYGQ